MWKKRKNNAKTHSGNDYWQSYSDMMAALLLMFILIMALTLVQSLRMFEEKNADLERQQLTIEAQQQELEAQKQELESHKEILEQQEQDLEQVKGELSELTQLVGVKSEIIEALQSEFSGSDLAVKVDEQTGAITFDTGIFFAVDSDTVRKEGQEFLNSFVPQYLSVLLSDAYRDSISEIIIEGHTDSEGSYMYNMDLSQRRAFAVAQFCLDESNNVLSRDQIRILRNILTANGRSFSNPIYDENGQIDAQASRRVVFKFRLKDDEMVSAIQDLLGGEND